MQWLSIKVAKFQNNKKRRIFTWNRTSFHVYMAKFSKADPGTLPYLR